MRDDDIRPLLDAAAAEPPPLGIDVGGIARRGQRIRRRRTVLAAVGSSTAVCGAIVLAVFVSGARNDVPVEPATPLPASTTTTSPGSTCFLTEGGPCPQNR